MLLLLLLLLLQLFSAAWSISVQPPPFHLQTADSSLWRVVPVVSCRRAEYKFRCDASWLLKTCLVDANDLTFLDDVDLVGLGRAWLAARSATAGVTPDGGAGAGGGDVVPLQVTQLPS